MSSQAFLDDNFDIPDGLYFPHPDIITPEDALWNASASPVPLGDSGRSAGDAQINDSDALFVNLSQLETNGPNAPITAGSAHQLPHFASGKSPPRYSLATEHPLDPVIDCTTDASQNSTEPHAWSSESDSAPELCRAFHDTKNHRRKINTGNGRGARTDAIKTDVAPKEIVKRGGVFKVFGLNHKVRSPFGREQKALTAATRRYGACVPCKCKKQRCDKSDNQYLLCPRCSRLPSHLLKQPCISIEILELNLHRRGSTLNDHHALWTTKKDELRLFGPTRPYAALSEHVIHVTQICGASFPVVVSRFQPDEGDTTGLPWTDFSGNVHIYDTPPWYIADREQALIDMKDWLNRCREPYIYALLMDVNPILHRSFEAALRYCTARKSTLVMNVLDLWVANRFIERLWHICDGSAIGMSPVQEQESRFFGKIPVTPAMDTQLDDIVIRGLLLPLREKILVELKRKIYEKKREYWFEIFLSILIILSNFEFIFADVVDWPARAGIQPTSRSNSLSRDYIHSCKTILAYFHDACNGLFPISMSWTPQDVEAAKLSAEQIAYLQEINKLLAGQFSDLQKWRTSSIYKSPMFWCAQLFCQDWRGDIPYRGPIHDFSEEDFLVS